MPGIIPNCLRGAIFVVFFYILKQVPIYFSCFWDAATPFLLLISRDASQATKNSTRVEIGMGVTDNRNLGDLIL